MHRYFPEDAIYRVDHWLGLDPLEDVLVARFANSMLEPLLNRDHVDEHPDHHGRGVRRRRPRPLLRPRPAPSATSCRTTCCRCWPASSPTRRTAPGSTRGWTPSRACIAALRPLTPADTVRGQYEGYLDVDGVDPRLHRRSPTSRSGSRSTPGGGRACRSSSGPARRMPVTAPRSRIRFQPAAVRRVRRRTRSHGRQHAAVPDLAGDARSASPWPGRSPARASSRSCRSWSFAEHSRARTCAPTTGSSAPRSTGNRVLFARQDTVEAAWRVVDPVLGDAVPVHPYPRGSWGPKEADAPAAGRRDLARPGRLSRPLEEAR